MTLFDIEDKKVTRVLEETNIFNQKNLFSREGGEIVVTSLWNLRIHFLRVIKIDEKYW